MIRHFTKYLIVVSFVLALPILAHANGLPVFTDLAAEAGKSVVFISTEVTAKSMNGQQFKQQIPEGHPFRDFFDRFDQFFGQPGQPNGQPRKRMGQGSGFVISANGHIVTNNHVIANADKVTVRFQDDDNEYVATVVGTDEETDLAVIKINAKRSLPVLKFGNSEALQVGEWVIAIGNPYGLDNTVTAGIISAKYRNLRVGPFDNFLQTDASINPGNSGGPLLNMKGEVIGINTLINAAGQNLGFAVPSNQAKKIIAQLKKGKTVKRGWLGVTIQGVDDNLAKALGLPKPMGALVNSVSKGQPADEGGVKQGDVILEVNGKHMEDDRALLKAIAGLAPGEKARLTLWRNNKRIVRTVTLGQRGEEVLAAMKEPGKQPKKTAAVLGMSMKAVNKKEAAALGLERAQGLLVVQVDGNSVAGMEGMRQGDVILQANQQDVNSVASLQGIVKKSEERGAVMLLIKRRGQNIIKALPLEKQ